jgi:hypothetical protein
MEIHDDFESLLKGAAAHYGEESLTEQTVSTMIDERLMESRNKLRSEFRKEIVIIAVTLIAIIYLVVDMSRNGHLIKPALRVALIGGLVYLAGSIVLFFQLLRIAQMQKDVSVSGYIKGLFTKTEKALLIYLWVSTIAATGTLATLFAGSPKVGGMMMVVYTLLMGVGMYYLNWWYTNKRFGKKMKELKVLLEEFE